MSLLNSKKLKELQTENEELKKLIAGLTEKENQLKHFDEMVKNARLEYADISTKKDHTAQKLEALEKEKTKLVSELNKISSEIKQLREIKITEQNQILSFGKAVNETYQTSEFNSEINAREIEAAEKRKNDIALETFKLRKNFEETNNKINNGKKVLNNLNTEIEKKKEEISSLIERQMLISDEQYKNLNLSFGNKSIDGIHLRIEKLSAQEKELTEMINNRKRLLIELDEHIGEKKLIVNSESVPGGQIDKISSAEISKKELNLEIEIKIEAMETQLSSLTEEFKAKTELFYELQSDNKQLSEDLQSGKEKLEKLNESIEVATVRLTDLDYSLNILEEEFEKISKDVSDKVTVKENIEAEIIKKTNQKIELDDVLGELRETTTILAQLKNDIEKGSGQSAKRFTGVIQYYSATINDIYKKKTLVEKSLIEKEKLLKSKQLIIDEKQALLGEMENVLFIRHSKLKLFENLTREITEQRKFLEINNFATEDPKQSGEFIVSSEINQKKLLEYENALKELMHNSDKYSSDLISTKILLEKEISDNKRRLNELNQNIRQSTSELTNLHDSINKIKIEHEAHRVSMNKLASVKTKLEDQIEKHKKIIIKYTNIKEKIKQEQELIKKKKELASSSKTSKTTDAGGKMFESHKPNWIKL